MLKLKWRPALSEMSKTFQFCARWLVAGGRRSVGWLINIIPITSSHPGEIWNEILQEDGLIAEPDKTLLTVIIKNNRTAAMPSGYNYNQQSFIIILLLFYSSYYERLNIFLEINKTFGSRDTNRI